MPGIPISAVAAVRYPEVNLECALATGADFSGPLVPDNVALLLAKEALRETSLQLSATRVAEALRISKSGAFKKIAASAL